MDKIERQIYTTEFLVQNGRRLHDSTTKFLNRKKKMGFTFLLHQREKKKQHLPFLLLQLLPVSSFCQSLYQTSGNFPKPKQVHQCKHWRDCDHTIKPQWIYFLNLKMFSAASLQLFYIQIYIHTNTHIYIHTYVSSNQDLSNINWQTELLLKICVLCYGTFPLLCKKKK